ncbi:MAG TPA: family 20 glycosylhydrolase [Bacilli bacterium]|nr:MAG: Beta-hexosaminidase [Tenericutes bacterium ADurb.BinA124]HNZ50345.1 family 20 glycosylhydrolase [Bacilli bacterium]HPX83882.1 family 20 glycosylhydrolase [Bacilli bacterium]
MFPKPRYQKKNPGWFLLSPKQSINYAQVFSEEIKPLALFWEQKWQTPLLFSSFSTFNLLLDFHLQDEQYHLSITSEQITISAKDKQGMAYGIATFLALIKEENKQVFVEAQEIDDFPAFSYRGLMLDVARHFFPITTIKKVIDVMAQLKLNVFHWHFSDDQGWRIESKVFPKLHENQSNFPASTKGYYSQEEIIDLVAYAAQKNITVVPEIDLPGHAGAILAAYPHLSHHEQLAIRTTYGIAKEIMCLGNEQLLSFLQTLIEEMISLFQPRYFHLGSDEVKLGECKKCKHCQQALKKHQLPHFLSLQTHLIKQLSQFLKSKKIIPLVWNDIAGEVLDASLIIQHWKPFTWKRTALAQSRGHQIILSPFFNYYLDYPYSMTPLKKVYSYNPLLNKQIRSHAILGLEACLWTEWIATEDKLFFHMFPRLAALADSAWRGFDQKDYREFCDSLAFFEQWLERQQIPYAKGHYQQANIFVRILRTIKWLKNKQIEYEKQQED